MELTLIAVLTTALFAVITMLGIALFQLPARFDRALSELREDFRDLRGEMRELRGEVVELRGEVVGLRGEVVGLRGEVVGLRGEVVELRERFDQHLRMHDQPA